jgi:hypothetical protein
MRFVGISSNCVKVAISRETYPRENIKCIVAVDI